MDNFEYNNISIIYERMLSCKDIIRRNFMAKQTGAVRLSNLFNMAGFIVDGYNGIRHDAKINKWYIYH